MVKQNIDTIPLKIGELLLVTLSIYFTSLVLLFKYEIINTEFWGYLIFASVFFCGLIMFIFIKDTLLGKIVYGILGLVFILSFALLTSVFLAQLAGTVLSEF